MTTASELRALALFEKVAEPELQQLIRLGSEVAFSPGDELWKQNVPADCWWVLLDGTVDLVRVVGHEETVLGAMSPGRWAGGFRAWDEHAVYLATGRATTAGRVLRVSAQDLKSWTSASDPFGAHLIEGVFRTARTVESMARQREALVALGTLAAGLAHELNNPAAAATRAVDALAALAPGSSRPSPTSPQGACRRSSSARSTCCARRSASRGLHPDCRPWRWPTGRRAGRLAGRARRRRGWLLAPALASAGVDVPWCDRAAATLGCSLSPGLTWVASTVTVASLLGEVTEATHRISDLVGAVKSYSQMDRAALQRTAVTEGLDSTLTVLKHRIPDGVTVLRDYAPDTPEIEGIAAELNQVWTNLIGNALDAMAGSGTLRISTRAERGGVVVEVATPASGPIPVPRTAPSSPSSRPRASARAPGLGLDISRRIVVGRHSGDITIDLRPGETVLRVLAPQPAPAGARVGRAAG
jgi:signal transduction histidine kinase